MIRLGEIVGQPSAMTVLQRLLGSGRMHHALLLAGPDGVGRRTTATALAAALLCEQPVTAPNAGTLPDLPAGAPLTDACGLCPSCRLMDAGSHPDFHLIYKELARYHDEANVRSRVMQNLGIDVIRSFVIEPAYRSPARGGMKLFLVLEAELMSEAAQNALLKTLEEPPAGTVILLVTDKPDQLLPTTLSRCLMVRFGYLPRPFVVDKLTAAGADASDAAFLAAYSEGSVGRAMQLHEAGMVTVKRQLVDALAELPPAGDAELGEKLHKIAEGFADEAVSAAKADTGADLSRNLATRTAAGTMLQLIASVYRDAMALATGADRPMIHADQPQQVRAIADRFAPVQLAEIVSQLSRYERLLWRNVSPRLVWDNVVITCASAIGLDV